jgi:hypothetical protein
MRLPVYNVGYSVVPISSLLLDITSYSVITTLVFNDTKAGYNDIALRDTSSITSDILLYQLIPHC